MYRDNFAQGLTASGVNMLQLLANRTSRREFEKAWGRFNPRHLRTMSPFLIPLGPILSPLKLVFFFCLSVSFSPTLCREGTESARSRRNEISRAGWPHELSPPLSCSVHDNLVIRRYRVDSVATLALSFFRFSPPWYEGARTSAMKLEENRCVASKLRF